MTSLFCKISMIRDKTFYADSAWISTTAFADSAADNAAVHDGAVPLVTTCSVCQSISSQNHTLLPGHTLM